MATGAGQRQPGQVSLVLEQAGSTIGRLEVAGADEELRDVDRELLSRSGRAGRARRCRTSGSLSSCGARLAETIALAEEIRQSRQRLLDTGREQRERFVLAVHRRVLTRLDAVDAAAASEPLEGRRLRCALAMEETRDCLRGAARPCEPGCFRRPCASGASPALDLMDQHRVPVVVRTAVAGDVRYPAAVEAAAYFCCVALADDLAPGERLAIELAGDTTELMFLARGSASPVQPGGAAGAGPCRGARR